MLDGASNITQGISGTATSLMSKPRITRLRRPRLLYSPDRILVIYREEEAFVKHLMENVESTKIDTKYILHHRNTSPMSRYHVLDLCW